MKPVLVSQRVEVLPDRNERRDALDQQLAVFLAACGFLAVPVPNQPSLVSSLFDIIQPAGVILSGGNDLAALGGDAPERDATEALLVDAAAASGIPVIGICRGMQFLIHRDGGELKQLTGHRAVRHQLSGTVNREVNSFHNWAITACGPEWRALSRAAEGSIEHAEHVSRRQTAIMWHPEREAGFLEEDIVLVRQALAIAS